MSDLADLLQFLAVRGIPLRRSKGTSSIEVLNRGEDLLQAAVVQDIAEHMTSLASIVPATGRPWRIVVVFGAPMVSDAEVKSGVEAHRTDAYMAWPC